MSQSCKYCNAQGLEYHENLGKLVNPINGRKHGFVECTSQPIPLFDIVNGTVFDRRPESIAFAITKEALRLGLNPFRVRTVRKGDNLFLE